MTIYLDVVFFENVILNFIIILSTSILSKTVTNTKRIMISSIIGGIYAILNYIVNLNSFFNIVIKIIISFIMIMIAFGKYSVKKVIKEVIFFYLVTFTFGGIAFMLLFFINPNNIVIVKNHFVGTYPIKVAILSGLVGFITISIVSKIIKTKINKKITICELEIFYNGKNKKIKTMLDTGNLLKEPISNADVAIVEKASLDDIVSKKLLQDMKYILQGEWIENSSIHDYKFKLVPFSSLGNENGLLIAFKPDYIKIYGEEELVRDDVLIAIYDGKLSRNNMYTSLIGLDILNNSKSIKNIS